MIEILDENAWHAANPVRPRGMLVTDLDGTLLGSDRRLAETDRLALEALGKAGYLRVIATGRNPHSFLRATGDDLPVDFVILSSGAAILDYRSRRYLRILGLEPEEVWTAAELIVKLDLDLMILDPLPDNHSFAYHPSSRPCPDYWKRIEIYEEHSRPLTGEGKAIHHSAVRDLWSGVASQLLAMDPYDSGRNAHETVKERLPDYTVLRATSPLGGAATWIEVFPSAASKSRSSAWLAQRFGLGAADVLAVGNDYNDLDLLEWGGASYVVANAPPDLLSRFAAVATNDAGGVAEAVSRWRAGRR
jgi:hydroxymethylpyrimidine pyrophosphatase-like HAD family hydrolase